jgi:Putative prokaryotic signal transducing protein
MTSHDSKGKDKSEPNVVTLRTFSNELDAELAKSALTAAGIYCLLSHDPLWRVDPFLSSTPGVSLTVRAQDAPRAKEILDGDSSNSK